MAPIQGLPALKEPCDVEITADAVCGLQRITQWIKRWKRRHRVWKATPPTRTTTPPALRPVPGQRIATIILAIAALSFAAGAADKKLTLKDLPAAVQKAVTDNLKGAGIKSIGKEKEDGVEQYEVETMLSGKHRDFNVDAKGKLLLVEEETTIDAIPAAAKATILKKVGTGKLTGVETFTKPGGETMFEAAYTSKAGKTAEMLVKADGTETKE